ncbi:MAG: hypothetical protein HRU14_14145 [Planctomycetes bacterium]|nr:hypothetical protein [Planctomycetota bacterium]
MSTGPVIAHLGRPGGDGAGFAALRCAFRERNPEHDVAWYPAVAALEAEDSHRIAFVASADGGSSVGDILVMRPGARRSLRRPADLLVFTLPEAVPEDVPDEIRPDHDPRITDTPGGCAEEEDAYRRICLTWLQDNGPYTYHALNAHRVRMWDSFSHYHPADDGFDEMYLVQEVRPGGHIVVSAHRERIETPDEVTREEAAGLLDRLHPEVGDLVFIPRGVIHRGVGGVLAHVITVPGFRPGCEVGVDHHLRAIGERLGMGADDGLMWQESASRGPMIK